MHMSDEHNCGPLLTAAMLLVAHALGHCWVLDDGSMIVHSTTY